MKKSTITTEKPMEQGTVIWAEGISFASIESFERSIEEIGDRVEQRRFPKPRRTPARMIG